VILAVAGGKGGVGKTTLAYNVAAELDGVVVDADLGMADLPDGRGPDLHDVLAGAADPVETVRSGPVDIVPCGRTLAGARAADLSRLSEAVAAVEREFGTVVLDCPAGRRADAGVPLAVADACLLVVSPRAFALADASRTRELAREPVPDHLAGRRGQRTHPLGATAGERPRRGHRCDARLPSAPP
jgi:septum site-determining protein MinD